MWLLTNKDVSVQSCETVTWVATSQADLNNTEIMKTATTTENNKRNYHMRGLRYANYGPLTWQGISLLDFGGVLNFWKNQDPLIPRPKCDISLRKTPRIGGKF